MNQRFFFVSFRQTYRRI